MVDTCTELQVNSGSGDADNGGMKLDRLLLRTVQNVDSTMNGSGANAVALQVPMGPLSTDPIVRTMDEIAAALVEAPAAFASFLGTTLGRGGIGDLSTVMFARKKGPRTDKKKGADTRKKTGERERNTGHKNGEEHSRTAKGNRGRRGSRGAR